MRMRGRRRRVAVVLVLGICLVALAAAFNIGWILLNWRESALLILGILLFPLIVAGLVLNTIFLVREIRRNEQHNAFINAVTHELKTPVASIRLYLETLQSRPVDPERRQEFYRVMLHDTDRLLASVEQILRTGRAGHAGRAIDEHRLEFAALVRECAGQVAARYELSAGLLQPDVNPEAAAAVVTGDPEELRAAVSNLLDNAVKYSLGPPGAPPAVRVTLDADDPDMWTLRVSDSGVGLQRTELKAIFKRFYRVPNHAAHISGTGLGLFIVRSVARRHGGRAFAQSAGLGRGSTFTLQLPRAPRPKDSAQPASSAGSAA